MFYLSYHRTWENISLVLFICKRDSRLYNSQRINLKNRDEALVISHSNLRYKCLPVLSLCPAVSSDAFPSSLSFNPVLSLCPTTPSDSLPIILSLNRVLPLCPTAPSDSFPIILSLNPTPLDRNVDGSS